MAGGGAFVVHIDNFDGLAEAMADS